MTSEPKGSSQPGVAGGRRKRPAMTIDATATEVTDAPASEPASAETSAAPETLARPADVAAMADHAELAAAPPLDREGSTPLEAGAPDTSVPPPPPPNGERATAVARDWTVLGVAGALVVLLIVAGLWLAGAFERSEDARLEKRLARMESQLLQLGEQNGAATGAAPRDTEALTRASQRVDEIERRMAKLETAPPARDAALADRLAAAEAAVKDVARRLAEPRPGADAETKALADRLAALEAATKALTARIAENAGRVDQVAAQARPPTPRRSPPASRRRRTAACGRCDRPCWRRRCATRWRVAIRSRPNWLSSAAGERRAHAPQWAPLDRLPPPACRRRPHWRAN